jgi:hypothetical protein
MPPGATSHNAPIVEARGALHATGLQNNLICKSHTLLDRTADSIHSGSRRCARCPMASPTSISSGSSGVTALGAVIHEYRLVA